MSIESDVHGFFGKGGKGRVFATLRCKNTLKKGGEPP